VTALSKLPPARAVLLDVTPRQLLAIAGDALPPGYRRQLQRYRYGMGVFKVDWALSEPIPWRAEACRRAGTIHIGPTLAEMAHSERVSWRGQEAEKPYVLVAQQSLFDGARAPDGRHTGWAYCHVPHGSTVDMTAAIENQTGTIRPRLPRHHPRPPHHAHGRFPAATIPTTSAETSTAACKIGASCSPAPFPDLIPTPRRYPASSSAPPPPRPAAAYTG
jgi:hypothetical protein